MWDRRTSFHLLSVAESLGQTREHLSINCFWTLCDEYLLRYFSHSSVSLWTITLKLSQQVGPLFVKMRLWRLSPPQTQELCFTFLSSFLPSFSLYFTARGTNTISSVCTQASRIYLNWSFSHLGEMITARQREDFGLFLQCASCFVDIFMSSCGTCNVTPVFKGWSWSWIQWSHPRRAVYQLITSHNIT